jgi:hypothetical protein
MIVAGMYGENPKHLDTARDAELKANPPAEKYARSKGVYQEWIEACKGGSPAQSAFDGHAGALTQMVLLGCLAVRSGKVLELNGTGGITNVKLPDEWVTPVYRKGWEL